MSEHQISEERNQQLIDKTNAVMVDIYNFCNNNYPEIKLIMQHLIATHIHNKGSNMKLPDMLIPIMAVQELREIMHIICIGAENPEQAFVPNPDVNHSGVTQ